MGSSSSSSAARSPTATDPRPRATTDDRLPVLLARLVRPLVPHRLRRRLPTRTPEGEEHVMTTPERLRRRQRRETAGIAILAFGLVASTFYFKAQDNEQDECLS